MIRSKKWLLLIMVQVLFSANTQADWAPNITSGSEFPDFAALDQSGKRWSNDNLSGKNGFLLLFNRSVVW